MSTPTSRSEMFYGPFEIGPPVPLFSWTTNTIRDQKGEPLHLQHTLSFTGTLLDITESGNLTTMLSKREELQNALASGNQEFKIIYDGETQVSGIFPRVQNVSFEEGVWADRIDYTFDFVYEEDFFEKQISSFNESWSFEEQDDRRTVVANHNVNAVGVNTNPSGTNNALTNARTFVLSKTGFDNVVSGHPAFAQVSGSFNAYEELRTEEVDVANGSFSVVESFTLSSGTFVHTRTAQLSQDQDGIGTVQLNGTIRGLGRGDIAFDRALDAWNNNIKPLLGPDASGIYTQLGGEATLFANKFDTFSITRNRFGGTLNYTVSYTDSPAENLPDFIQEFNIQTQENKPTRVHAIFLIPQRAEGPIDQDILTTRPGSFTINGNAVGKPSADFAQVIEFVRQKVQEKIPAGGNITQHNLTKDENNKTVNFSITWETFASLSEAVDQRVKIS